MAKRRKKALTLLEIMIVIFLIGVIGSVVGVNMKKSMDKAKVFKTESAKAQVEDILNMELSRGTLSAEELEDMARLKDIVLDSGLAKKADDLLKDGWGEYFKFKYDAHKDLVTASSDRLKQYKEKSKTSSRKKVLQTSSDESADDADQE